MDVGGTSLVIAVFAFVASFISVLMILVVVFWLTKKVRSSNMMVSENPHLISASQMPHAGCCGVIARPSHSYSSEVIFPVNHQELGRSNSYTTRQRASDASTEVYQLGSSVYDPVDFSIGFKSETSLI